MSVVPFLNKCISKAETRRIDAKAWVVVMDGSPLNRLVAACIDRDRLFLSNPNKIQRIQTDIVW